MYVKTGYQARAESRTVRPASLHGLADAIRDIAMFRSVDASGELLTIADQITILADESRRLAGAGNRDGAIAALELRLALGLPYPKCAQLLLLLMQRPDQWQSRESLARRLNTSRQSMFVMISQIRRALSELGLRDHLATFQDGYYFSGVAIDAIKSRCDPALAAWWSPYIRARKIAPDCGVDAASPGALAGSSDMADTAGAGATGADAFSGESGHSPFREPMLPQSVIAWHQLSRLGQRGSTQMKILFVLLRRRGEFVAYHRLAAEVGCTSGSLKVMVNRIRQKFYDLGFPSPIENRRVQGYRAIAAAFDPDTRLGAFLAGFVEAIDTIPPSPTEGQMGSVP
ncbi:helix-turn-helix domain-containing protein [Sphingopyxis sp.]|uniref:helix-turn-helix domain-containing protein n=1 Tax=Sphingopyxis sp. TaxID=1908224 RepID=UPI003BAAC225